MELAREVFWPVHRVLLTGDLVHDESAEGYRLLEGILSRFGAPCSCIPGNHDSSRVMTRALGDHLVGMGSSVRSGAWNLVLLDSTVPGEDRGHLDRQQLEHLEVSLSAHADAHALVCLHHQPVSVGSAWVDTVALDNPQDLFALTDRHPQVRGILWGHVHQEFSSRRRGVELYAAPSTCVQFLPGSEDFAVDTRTPGFRWLELYPDGRIRTGIERIAAYPDSIDLTAGGY
jgi:Icc protein